MNRKLSRVNIFQVIFSKRDERTEDEEHMPNVWGSKKTELPRWHKDIARVGREYFGGNIWPNHFLTLQVEGIAARLYQPKPLATIASASQASSEGNPCSRLIS